MHLSRALPNRARLRTYLLVAPFIVLCVVALAVVQFKLILLYQAQRTATDTPPAFPIGVNPSTKDITEQPSVDNYYTTEIAPETNTLLANPWFSSMSKELVSYGWFQNLATPLSRTLVIYPGERKEEVVTSFGKILGWNQDERQLFSLLVSESVPSLADGKFMPGHYVVRAEASPLEVAETLIDRLDAELLARYPEHISEQIALADALTIASLIEREAADFSDMRYISGIIWNRLFIDMPLQLDASLQYAKADNPYEPSWWPRVNPADKFIDSAYNTYQNEGLPPAPISNPSLEAMLATLNPKETPCLFYFHTSSREFICSETYEEHVTQLRFHYGRGR